MSEPTRKFILTDAWYVEAFPAIGTLLTDGVSGLWLKLLHRSALLRAVAMSVAGRRYEELVTCWDGTGRILTVIEGLLGRRKLVLLEFIDFDYRSNGLPIALIYGWIIKWVFGPCLRRCALRVQVFTAFERELVVRKYGLPEERVALFTWPLLGEIQTRPLDAELGEDMVFSSGRAACDWGTLVAAQKIGGWPLTIVCSDKDRPWIDSLQPGPNVRVLNNIPRAEHDALFASATVYALCLKEKFKSSGQIRLASAIEAGVPVVASRVLGLEGYLVDGVTGVSVPPGDAEKLAAAVSHLLTERQARKDLVQKALEFARNNTKALYFERIERMLQEARPGAVVGGQAGVKPG